MSSIILTRPDGRAIANATHWSEPKKQSHKKPGRSATELPLAWFRSGTSAAPSELIALLKTRPELSGLKIQKGIPERVTALPEPGEGRNHDLWLLATAKATQVTICVEAKADEPFGNDTVGEYRTAALKRRDKGESTRVPDRIEKLLQLVPGGAVRWDSIRYQLLTAICGTALQAKEDGSSRAVFAVHEFHTSRTKSEKIAQNAADFADFLRVLGHHDVVKAGNLYGPFQIAGVPCLVGKVIAG